MNNCSYVYYSICFGFVKGEKEIFLIFSEKMLNSGHKAIKKQKVDVKKRTKYEKQTGERCSPLPDKRLKCVYHIVGDFFVRLLGLIHFYAQGCCCLISTDRDFASLSRAMKKLLLSAAEFVMSLSQMGSSTSWETSLRTSLAEVLRERAFSAI